MIQLLTKYLLLFLAVFSPMLFDFTFWTSLSDCSNKEYNVNVFCNSQEHNRNLENITQAVVVKKESK